MKQRFTEEQIIKIIQEAKGGLTVKSVFRQYAIAQGTYYRWRNKFDGLTLSEGRRLKTLETENKKLQRLFAEQDLDIVALKDVVSKKW